MCLFVFYAPPVALERAARLPMEKDQCLHAPHGLTSTKQSPAPPPLAQKPEPPSVSPSNQTQSSQGVFPPRSLHMQNSCSAFIWAQEVVVVCGELCVSVQLNGFSDLGVFLFYRVGCKMQCSRNSSHFITEGHCVRVTSVKSGFTRCLCGVWFSCSTHIFRY